MGNSLCPSVSRRQQQARRHRHHSANNSNQQAAAHEETRNSSHSTPTRISLNSIHLPRSLSRPFNSYADTLVYVGPGMRQPLSQLSEEEQIQICIRLGLIDSLQMCTYDDSKRDKFCECAICMEEYAEGCKLRILPCLHAYHRECIDDWLQRSFTCPSCQQDLLQQLSAQQQHLQGKSAAAASESNSIHEAAHSRINSELGPAVSTVRHSSRRRLSGGPSGQQFHNPHHHSFHRRQPHVVTSTASTVGVTRSRSSSSLPSASSSLAANAEPVMRMLPAITATETTEMSIS